MSEIRVGHLLLRILVEQIKFGTNRALMYNRLDLLSLELLLTILSIFNRLNQLIRVGQENGTGINL